MEDTIILDRAERDDLISREPESERFIRPFIGGREYLHHTERWILYLYGASPHELRKMPLVRKRIEEVLKYRQTSGGKLANSLAKDPTVYHVNVVPASPYLAIPEVSSETREYIPIGWLEPPTIPSNKLLIMPDASKEVFGILTSRMHMAWLAHIGGRLKSDFQYSGGVVFNTFPYPEMSGSARQLISSLADTVLAARNAFPEASLSDLYDPVLMPPPLRKAHHALDVTVDKLYQPQVFATDTERVEHLFGLYEKMIDPLTHQTATARKRRARTPVV